MEFYQKTLHIAKDKIYAPRVNDVVDATTESHIYQVEVDMTVISIDLV